MVNNFDLILEKGINSDIKDEDGLFYHCQILRRPKDFPNEKVPERLIKAYFVRSANHLVALKDEIITLCDTFKARAYINLSLKSIRGIQLLALEEIAKDLSSDDTRNPNKVLNSIAGKLKSKIPMWVVDVDDLEEQDTIESFIGGLVDGQAIYLKVPTKSGIHLITRPFNRDAFSRAFPDVGVQINAAGTLLYCPEIT